METRDLPNWDREKEWNEQIAPLLQSVLDKCTELGIPILMFSTYKKNDTGIGMVQARNGNEMVESHVPPVMKALLATYDMVTKNGLEISGLAFVPEEEVNAIKTPPPGTQNGQYLN